MIADGFIINPPKELLPNYRISPFRTIDIIKNRELPDSNLCDSYFKGRFSSQNYIYTLSGRDAINRALSNYNLDKKDCVTILTTSGNFYISGCVTKEIEKYCKWSRKIEPDTKLIYVNHEFGYPYQELRKLKDYNVPIIEDCAHTFFSKDKNNDLGEIGDFVIYSFSKIFQIQVGGLLVSNISESIKTTYRIDVALLRYIKNVLSYYLVTEQEIINNRIHNHNFLANKFKTLGFTPRFQLEHGTVPGVFLFKTNNQKLDLPELQKYYWAHGVHCSVFYGEEAFYIPVNQVLNDQDMQYFFEVIKSFLNQAVS